MVYYRIQLKKNESNSCTIIFPQGKYRYKRLPMGIANIPDIFQQTMNNLFHWFEFIRAYIDEVLILTKGDWAYNIQKLELTLNKTKEKSLKCNTEKSLFGKI